MGYDVLVTVARSILIRLGTWPIDHPDSQMCFQCYETYCHRYSVVFESGPTNRHRLHPERRCLRTWVVHLGQDRTEAVVLLYHHRLDPDCQSPGQDDHL